MKLSKKFFALCLCVAMVLSLAACSSGEGKPSSTAAASSEASSKTAESSAVSDKSGFAPTEGDSTWFEGRDFSEPITISLASVQIVDGKDYNNNDEFVKWWADTFNIQWEITSLSFENWAERLRIWINSDDMPDMCVWNYVQGEAINYVDQGLLKELPEGWTEQYANVAKAQFSSPMGEMTNELFGGDYFLFRPIFANNAPSEKISDHLSLYLRKDWAEAAGCEVKNVMTLPEFYDCLAKIKAADPGNVGASFSPLVCRTGNLAQLVQFNSTYSGVSRSSFYVGEDGTYQWGPANEDTLEALKMMNKAYNDGLIDPEFYTIQDPDDLGEFYTTGTSAAIIADGMAWRMTEFDSHLSQDLGLKFEDTVANVTLVDADGNFHNQPSTNYWGTTIFSPHIEDEKLDRILQMMDYSCTEEGQLLIRCGFQDYDWKYDENGEIVSLLEDGVTFRDKYVANPVYENLMILSDDFQFQDPNYKKIFRDRTAEMYRERSDNSTEETFPAKIDWTTTFFSSQAMNQASMTYADEYASLIVKEGDIEKNWQDWVDSKMPLIQPVLDELNAELQ